MTTPLQTISRARAAETENIIKFLRTVSDDRTVTYEELITTGGFGPKDKESRVKACIRSACKTILREDAIVFAPVNGIGIKRATPLEVAQMGEDAVGRTRRASNRTMRKLATIDPASLPPEDRIKYFAASSQLGAIGHLTGRSAHNKLVQRITQSQVQIDVAATLSLASEVK